MCQNQIEFSQRCLGANPPNVRQFYKFIFLICSFFYLIGKPTLKYHNSVDCSVLINTVFLNFWRCNSCVPN